MDLDTRARVQRRVGESREVDVGAEIDEAGVGKGRGGAVGADAAEGGGGDRGGWAVVED